jgi:pyruvate dehydrogenase E2 component (dihydrolipoamide acetyltransferase)
MRYEFNLPDIGEGLTEAIVRGWMVKVGDQVKEDDPVCELETDKTVVEITSPCDGTILALNGKEGDVLKVGTLLIAFETEAVPDMPAPHGASAPASASAAVANEEKAAPATAVVSGPVTPINADVRAVPSTRRFAREHGIDLSQLAGSGPGGRILRADVERSLSGVSAGGNVGSVAQLVAPTAIPHAEGQQRIPIKGLRRAIAETMVRSVTVIPHATSMFRCNGERFLTLRKVLQEKMGVRVSFTAMVIKAMVPALQRYPNFNSSVDDTTNEIVLPGQINIGFATHTDEGLIVPVIKNVDRKSLAEISQDIDRLAALARDRKISAEDLRGGTITLSNVGSHGTAETTGGRPIINHPQSAVIVMSRIKPQPVVRNGQVVAQQCLDIGTSYDHRIIDGIYAALFMETVINVIEEPGLLLGL